MNERGVVYCLTDSEAYLEAVLISALTLRSFEPNLAIAIVSNLAVINQLSLEPYGIFTRLLTPQEVTSNAFASRDVKTRLFNLSPFTETLYLDADILPCDSVSELWKYLDRAPLAMVNDRLPQVEMCDHISLEEKDYTLQQIPPNSAQFNSGVMLWRKNETTQNLFTEWQKEWRIFQKQDQLALVRAIHRCQISVASLPQTYNVSPIDSVALIEAGHSIHLLHCWGGMVASGEFRQIARSRYPEIVEKVDFLRLNCFRSF